MEHLRALTENINVVVRFFQSVNCLFWQLHWLEQNILRGSNERLVIGLLILILVGYMTFGCASTDSTNNSNSSSGTDYFCGNGGVSWLILLAAIGVIVYYLYKRSVMRDTVVSDDPNYRPEEREKFISATVPPFDQIEMGNVNNIGRHH